jgi:asparagine synthase (glutamine-hydrolysing)
MLALAWPREPPASDRASKLADRLASSLCAGIGGIASAASIDGISFAYRPLRGSAAIVRRWRPTVLPSGRIVLFHGYFDNAPTIAKEIDADCRDVARLYGLAAERWGDAAETRIVGDYCAVIADPASSRLRLSRSPLRAPPLHYFHGHELTAVASVPRAIFAAGVEQRLNDAHAADAALSNLSDSEATWFKEVRQVPTGCVVELEPGRPRVLRETYDVLAIPDQPARSDAEVIARAGELLDDGVRACLAGFSKPGATLSGGLDSPQVAVRALAALRAGQKLPTFTFHPEPGFDGRAPARMMGDERPLVEAFAALHPGLQPHFTDNRGYGHDHRWKELFHLIGAPSGLNTMYVFHGLLAAAAQEHCDVLLLAQWGNFTFSDRGDSGFVEYFLKGHWRQLWLALTRPAIHEGSIARRFALRCLSALLPNGPWLIMRRLLLGRGLLADVVQPLSADFRRASGADRRLRRSGILIDRYQPWNRRHSRKLLMGNGDPAEIHQGFEQMYGVALRDPTAYRPFVEFCLGLPTRMFMRDGEMRWLAKQMAKGIMPEEQRTNPRFGWWDADWHVRIGRRRTELIAELDRLEKDERMRRMLDLPRLRAALEDWPDRTEVDPRKCFGAQIAVQKALLTARFINYVEGRNLP